MAAGAAQRFRLASRQVSQVSTMEHTTAMAPAVVAATGRRLLGLRFSRPGPATVRLEYRSPYSEAPPVESYVLHALVEPRPSRFSLDQVVDGDDAWTEPVRQRQLELPLKPLEDIESLVAETEEI
jgi:hypothetical protein